MSGSYLTSLAALAVHRARVWQPRLPARFEEVDAWADEPWSEVAVERDLGGRSPAGNDLRIDRPTPRPADRVERRTAMETPAARPDTAAPAARPARVPPHVGPAPQQRPLSPPAVPAPAPAATAPAERPGPTLSGTVDEIADGTPAEPTAPRVADRPRIENQGRTIAAAPVSVHGVPAESRPLTNAAVVSKPRPTPLPSAARVERSTPRSQRPQAAPQPPPDRPAPVSVHIGRVDVRAVVAPSPVPAAPQPATPRPGPDLEDYLRDGGRR